MSTNATPPKLHYAPDYTLRLEFDDIRPSDIVNDSDKFFYKLFSERQAHHIASFVFEHKDEVETIICQCEYGMSRRAGVAAAIKEYFNNDGISIFADKNYYANIYVFRLTLKALKEYKL